MAERIRRGDPMAMLVLTIGGVNILLGYALAYYMRCLMDGHQVLDEPDPTLSAVESPPELPIESDDKLEHQDADDEDLLAGEDSTEVIPGEWVDRLEAESIHAKTLVEATAQVMRLEVGRYREAMIRLEEEGRSGEISLDLLQRVTERVLKLNQSCSSKAP